jgi:hypothetical protein
MALAIFSQAPKHAKWPFANFSQAPKRAMRQFEMHPESAASYGFWK